MTAISVLHQHQTKLKAASHLQHQNQHHPVCEQFKLWISFDAGHSAFSLSQYNTENHSLGLPYLALLTNGVNKHHIKDSVKSLISTTELVYSLISIARSFAGERL